jgi:hypothetical protein
MQADGPAGEPEQDLAWRWHDNLIYGIGFEIGDPGKGDWRSDLVFDIDFIVEWLCRENGSCRFLVAPARLAFHDAGDLAIRLDHGDGAGRIAMNELAIDRVSSERISGPIDMFRWEFRLASPAGGLISFSASGFTETLLAEPTLRDEQHLPRGGPGWRTALAAKSPSGPPRR